MIHRHRAAGLHNMPPTNGMGVQPSYSSVPQQQQQPVSMQQQQSVPMQQQQPRQYQSDMRPDMQQGQNNSSYAQPPQGGPRMYGLPQGQGGGIAAPTPYYPQTTSPSLAAQHTGNSYSNPEHPSPVSYQGMYQPPQQVYEAHGTQVAGYHP